jgi:hypothetical protein
MARAKLIDQLKQIPTFTAFELKKIISEVFRLPVHEVERVSEMNDTQSIDVAIAKVMVKAMKGDLKHFEFLLDRVVGKPVETQEVMSYTFDAPQIQASSRDKIIDLLRESGNG